MPDTVKSPVIYWIRRDLRLSDNRALSSAANDGRPVIPVCIRERDGGIGVLGAAQAWWLERSLEWLAKRYDALGAGLVLRTGKPLSVLRELIEETGAQEVFWNRRYDPDGIATDASIKKALRDDGIAAESFAGHILHEPSRFKTKTGGPYKVYTPFWKAFSSDTQVPPPLDAPEKLTVPKTLPRSESLHDWNLYPGKPNWAHEFSEVWTPGEAGALERLQDFLENDAAAYADERDRPTKTATSRLSPHLTLGEISPATIWHKVEAAKKIGAENRKKFLQELMWRDFSYHLLFHAPDLAKTNWNSRFDAFEWHDDEEGFDAWTRGRTGYPVVDAGMRQLWRQGYMHNRVRMIAASFLIKDLMIDWRRGEAWFRDTLVDADPASNAASWQWVAGSGADAAPFFRIFNPILQGEKFDPEGDYVRTYVPELAKLPARHIHAPFNAPQKVLEKAGIKLGETYPNPIVDHKSARERALSAFKAIKD